MGFVGYHASHEQLPPSDLLTAVADAERAGFDGAMCSDHFAPWGVAQGESGFAWSWLGAALATTRFSIGTVTAPGQRYHPAIVAQAVATLSEMFPGRFWCALGSGEAVNEHITGEPWPDKAERQERVIESVHAMRRLLAGERVDHEGMFQIDDARIWSRPPAPPPLFAAAVSPETAEWAAEWADGVITVGHDPEQVGRTIDAYRDAGGRGPCAVQVHVSLADSQRNALRVAAGQWRQSTVPGDRLWDITQPEEFDRLADPADETALRASVLVSDDPGEVVERLRSLQVCGADELYLHGVGKDQSAFLEAAEDRLLPGLREAS